MDKNKLPSSYEIALERLEKSPLKEFFGEKEPARSSGPAQRLNRTYLIDLTKVEFGYEVKTS